MPASFRFQFWSGVRQLWVPRSWTAGDQDRGSQFVHLHRPAEAGVHCAQARERDGRDRPRPRERVPQRQRRPDGSRVMPLGEFGVDRLRPALVAMLGVVGFVLLIACVNVANLMLARAAARQRELAIRCALGAAARASCGSCSTESVMLACAGGICGRAHGGTGGRALLVPILPATSTVPPAAPRHIGST